MTDIKTYISGLDRFTDAMKEQRRDFHRHAEPGWREFYTSAKLIGKLRELGIPVKLGKEIINTDYLWSYPSRKELDAAVDRAKKQGADPGILKEMGDFTGACAIIETAKPGPVVALRFDIDCNDVQESTDAGRIPSDEGFCSENPGCMHACGHDGHGTMGLFVCRALSELKEELSGTIKVIFQPAEEGVRGAKSVAESGILDDVDIFLTSHLGMGWKTGELVGLSKGFLSTTKVDAEITGLSAHAGASPQDGNNAILAACAAALAMHTACQDSRGASRINVGTIRGGSGRNVVAENAFLQLETRGETAKIEQNVYRRAIDSLEGAAKMFGCTVKTEIKGSAASSDSDESLEPYISAGASRVPEITSYTPKSAFSGSEDATYLMSKVQSHGGRAAYMCIGSTIAAPHHNNKFDLDERSLLIGLKLYVSILWEILH
ncbi:MAG: M20 family metallo-hydrolase [Lachnospiraceae bacterium]|nr:M20 family metallo-hydrolase [Lachnospiraceae bacterium]